MKRALLAVPLIAVAATMTASLLPSTEPLRTATTGRTKGVGTLYSLQSSAAIAGYNAYYYYMQACSKFQVTYK